MIALPRRFERTAFPLLALVVGGACGRPAAPTPAPTPVDTTARTATSAKAVKPAKEPRLPPQLAMLYGLLPLHSTGVDLFRNTYPAYDGRGVLIGILDSGVDPDVPGLQRTTTGEPKLLDLRDFSGEGAVPLTRVMPREDGLVTVGPVTLRGFSRVAAVAEPPYWGGTLAERSLGKMPASDINGDGDDDDVFAFIVGKASDGWVLFTDTNGDGSLSDETPIRDYAVARETFKFGPLTMAANLGQHHGVPTLDLFFDNSGHGTHVSGIATGHDMFGVKGFDGVAPGAQEIALKIANDARGGISVTGSMARAMDYAAAFAERLNMPLVLNMSFGVGNEREGTAAIDSILDAFALRHPDVLFVVSAGNDGPGISTMGFPGTADYALTACALFPGVFARVPKPGVEPAPDVIGWWSSRGGETQKPDLCTPGVAFSNVPAWDTGEEVAGGTSMAAPELAGAAALLQSAMAQVAEPVRAIDLRRALMATATPVPGATVLDEGTGVPDVSAAFRWLRGAHQAGRYAIRVLPDGSNTSIASAAYRRTGLASATDTLQRFVVQPVVGQPAARLFLRSDATWLDAPAEMDFSGEADTVAVRYDPAQLREPGLYVGTVWARSSTDTLGGAAFGLTNTIIVPRALDRPFRDDRHVAAGQLYRYFFTVPAGSGGLRVTISVSDPQQEATLDLFEPNGQPARGTATVDIGNEEPPADTILVAAEDVVPGVYEADVVARPLVGVTYTLTAALPGVALAHVDESGRVTLGSSRAPDSTTVTADWVGATRQVRVSGAGAGAKRIPVTLPPWATKMVVDVQLPPALWGRFTDFGVSVFDSSGHLASEEPLNYAFGRALVPLDSVASRRVDIELFPALALPNSREPWTANVTISVLADSAIPLAVTGAGPASFHVDAAGPVPITPDEFLPLATVTARVAGTGTPPSTRNAAIRLTSPAVPAGAQRP